MILKIFIFDPWVTWGGMILKAQSKLQLAKGDIISVDSTHAQAA